MSRKKQASRRNSGLKRKLDDDVDVDPATIPSKRAVLDVANRPKQSQPDETIAMMDPALLADHFAKCTRACFPDSSAIKLEDRYLPTKAFSNTIDFDKSHIGTNLPSFLEKFSEDGKVGLSTCVKEGTPHTLVITSSGIRTADLTRELRVFNTKDSKVAKLIAKHMKLKDNVKYMQGTKVGVAIGTPTRLKDLIDADALMTDGLRRIIVDGSYRDEKKRTIFEMDELFRPLIDLLNVDSIRQRYGVDDNKIEIMVF